MNNVKLIGFDLSEKTDQSVEQIKSKGEYFKVCEDKDDDCIHVKCKTSCYLHDPSKGICPYIVN